MEKIKVAILGPGNIGSDLMYKVFRSEHLEMGLMAGIAESEGIKRARSFGVPASVEGIDGVLELDDVDIVFDATNAFSHYTHAPLLESAGKIAIDLTPAAVGPYLVPCVNIGELSNAPNVNMVTCGGQATIPIVYAISRVAGAKYSEIVACISSLSAGPGTRANIDEFTQTTAKAIEIVGGADKGKAIIVLNPADPPITMSNTIYVQIKNRSAGIEAIAKSIDEMVADVQKYVPGYRLAVPPMLDGDKVTVCIQVEGAGDFLPAYSGNLDIINSAAIGAAEIIAKGLLAQRAK
ncbi:MAG: acetaldehyde dehydrogenase (acetylating) [Eubacteriaceae bacterium]|nr:acetaldehyde dehydrogenase (acetylating) [Eubacteriaceae bacterium]